MPIDQADNIASDIKSVDAVLSPIVTVLNPAIGTGLSLALRVVAAVEPAVYRTVVAVLQGKELTPEQVAALEDIQMRLQNPEQYFA